MNEIESIEHCAKMKERRRVLKILENKHKKIYGCSIDECCPPNEKIKCSYQEVKQDISQNRRRTK